MRISDWSSDVCSSDLLDAVLEDVADKVEILLHSIGSSMVGVQVESAQTMPSSGVSTSPRDTTTAAARSPVTFSVVRHMSRKRSTPSTSPMPSRSEEHTSELQSLMRNSYAVFCLKQKK